MENEKKYLDYVLNLISRNLEEELETFDELEFKYRRDPDRYGVAYKIACNSLKVLKNGILKPYFARIDFSPEDKLESEKIYIGKYGIYDKNSKPIVVDWRAPISSLYYDSEIGPTSYCCPEGTIFGKLTLKRQFEIENGKLLNYHDVDIVSNDELLQKYLHTNNDMRLKNIVSTIQSEQNVAIRKPLNLNTIVQGVAGSGKTTIALHRIAYLVYNYRDRIKNNQYMVIGPNDVFLKYIESVLPDLDVSDINQQTYEKFTKEIIDEPINIINSSKKLNMYLAGKIHNDIPKFKSSDEFRIMLDLFLDDYFQNIIEDALIIKGFEVIDKGTLYQIFKNALQQSADFDIAVDKFVILVSNYINNNYNDIIFRLNEVINKSHSVVNNEKEKEELKKKRKYIYDEIQKGCKQSSKKFISKYRFSPTKLYQLFINNIENYDVNDYCYIDELKKETLQNIKSGSFEFEDLAPLIHIKYRLGISRNFMNYRHVVIDEAQDLGKFSFYVLKECLPNATFSIYGDIVQSIYDYRSIDSWDEVRDVLGECELLSFKKSYRTTDEIMTVANSVAESLKFDSSELSIRHGNDVSFSQIEQTNIPAYIKNKIVEYRQKGYKTVAVISKYPVQSSYINDDLSFEGLFVPNVDENTDITKIDNEVLTISNYLAKGLEFDAVIINGADEDVYNSLNASDMKMLYVALTRALHEMDIVYSKKLSKPLIEAFDKVKIKKNTSNTKCEKVVLSPVVETDIELKCSSVTNINISNEDIKKNVKVDIPKVKKELPKAVLKKSVHKVIVTTDEKKQSFTKENPSSPNKTKIKRYSSIDGYKG